MDILKDLRDGKPCRWTGVCSEMSAVGGCTCGEAADEIERLREALRFYADMENYIQVDQSTVFVPIITVDLQPQLDNGRTARAALGEA